MRPPITISSRIVVLIVAMTIPALAGPSLNEAQNILTAADSVWNLPPEIKNRWKETFPFKTYPVERMGDEQIQKLRREVQIPQEEQLIGAYSNNDTVNGGGFEAVFTDQAIYVVAQQSAANPNGRLRIGHSALLVTERLDQGSGQKPFRHYEKDKSLNVKIYGSWIIQGKEVVQFPNEMAASATRGNHHEFQEFLARIIIYDKTFATEAARANHLQAQPEVAPMAGYQSAKWGMSPVEVQKLFETNSAKQYHEDRLSVAEWDRLRSASAGGEKSAGERTTEWANGWRVPVRPPFFSFEFQEASGTKAFLFFQEKFYAVLHRLDRNWLKNAEVENDKTANSRGPRLFAAMRKKYGQPTLELRSDLNRTGSFVPDDAAWISWHTDEGSIRAQLSAIPEHVHTTLERFPVHTPQGISSVAITAAGYVGKRLSTNVQFSIPRGVNRAQRNPPWITLRMPEMKTVDANGKWLVVVIESSLAFHERTPESKAAITSLAQTATITNRLGLKATAQTFPLGDSTTRSTEIPPDVMGLAFDVAESDQDFALNIGDSDVIGISLKDQPWTFTGIATADQLENKELYPLNISYSSTLTCNEIESLITKMRADSEHKREEKKKQDESELNKF